MGSKSWRKIMGTLGARNLRGARTALLLVAISALLGADPAPVWPAPGAPLRVGAPPVPAAPVRFVLDAGHGATGNYGNTSSRCEKESVFTRRAASALAERIARFPGMEPILSRPDETPVPYDDRIRLAEAREAPLVSLHSDAREAWRIVRDEAGCPQVRGAAGFSVLYSDEGSADLVASRLGLARSIAAGLRDAGFPPYLGPDYEGIYTGDPGNPGVYLDRHAPEKRIRVLRRPTVPSVIVETHQALDPEEAARWEEPGTLDAFAAGLAAGLAVWAGPVTPGFTAGPTSPVPPSTQVLVP